MNVGLASIQCIGWLRILHYNAIVEIQPIAIFAQHLLLELLLDVGEAERLSSSSFTSSTSSLLAILNYTVSFAWVFTFNLGLVLRLRLVLLP